MQLYGTFKKSKGQKKPNQKSLKLDLSHRSRRESFVTFTMGLDEKHEKLK